MRVLHITTEFPPFIIGGCGRAVGGLADASARAGLDVGVLLITDAPPASAADERSAATRAPGVTLFQIHDSDPAEVAARIAEEWRPDVLHLHVPWVLPFVRTILERVRVPVVYTLHSLLRAAFDIGREPAHILEYSDAQEKTIGLARRVIALTHNEAALTSGYYPEARERIRVVGNGIDDSASARRAARRRGLGEAPLVLYAGRLVERKGVRELLSAVPQILDGAPDTRFLISGGPHGRSAQELEREWLPAECAPHRERICFTGWLSTEQLARCYSEADLLVVPSRYEPFGLVILEGMLYGLPIAAADVGGPGEILEHEQTGLLFPPGDVGALARAVLRLVTNQQLRRRLGEAAAREVRARWLWPGIAAQVHRVYREALEETPS